MAKVSQIEKPELCIYSGSPSLVKISKDISRANCIAYVSKLLSRLNSELNIGGGMNEHQIISCADSIIKEFYYLNLAEIAHVFNKGKLGYYGKAYNRIDVMIIFEWLNEYSKERDAIAITKNTNDKKAHEAKFNEVILPILKANLQEIEKPKGEQMPKEKLPYHDFYQQCLRNFDELRKKESDESGRFAMINGKPVTVEQFFEMEMEKLSNENL